MGISVQSAVPLCTGSAEMCAPGAGCTLEFRNCKAKGPLSLTFTKIRYFHWKLNQLLIEYDFNTKSEKNIDVRNVVIYLLFSIICHLKSVSLLNPIFHQMIGKTSN